MRWARWQERHLDDVLLFQKFNIKKACDHAKMSMIEANHF